MAHIGSMQADMGGAELMHLLRHVLGSGVHCRYTLQVFVLTDGEVSNTVEVIDLVRRHQHNNRVFALGLGHGASHELVEGFARARRGTAEFVAEDRLETKVIGQLRTAIQPALNDVTVEWDVPLDETQPTAQPANPAPYICRVCDWQSAELPQAGTAEAVLHLGAVQRAGHHHRDAVCGVLYGAAGWSTRHPRA
jgi:hypothetical protein